MAAEMDEINKRVVVKPWNTSSIKQLWRWDGWMIKSSLYGLVWKMAGRYGPIVVDEPARSVNREFLVYNSDPHIYPNQPLFQYGVVVTIFDGYPVTEYGLVLTPLTSTSTSNQQFTFVYNYLPNFTTNGSTSKQRRKTVDKLYFWFYIIVDRFEAKEQLAVDFENGPLRTTLIVNSFEKGKKSQMWRWDGQTIKNKQNGLVWHLESPNSDGFIQLKNANNEFFQLFNKYDHYKYIFVDGQYNSWERIVEIYCTDDIKRGAKLTTALKKVSSVCSSNNRYFRFQLVDSF
ncbi:hypothetical protein CHUAL_012716 [Chamberlinius hualienensis]